MRPLSQTQRSRFRRAGPVLYVAGAAQYFVIQAIVALRYTGTYSLTRDTISDLGNTACGTFNDRYVCSPAHALMNLSFIALGVTMIAGTLLIHPLLDFRPGTTIGLSMFATAGGGVVLVGVFPENTVPALHGIGAALAFLLGNIGLVVLGPSLPAPRAIRLYTVLSGGIALVALVFYAGSHHLGLGEGGIERVVAYPQTLWQLVFGLSLLLRPPLSD
jgi:hypothetical membrane protein